MSIGLVDRARCGNQCLTSYLTAVDSLAILVRRLPAEDVHLDQLEIEQGNEVIQGAWHATNVASMTNQINACSVVAMSVFAMPEDLKAVALTTKGFMPEDEGDALFVAACLAAQRFPGANFVEIGSYCGRSTVWLGAAAQLSGVSVHAVDHHGGSEENQPGWEWHDESLVDPSTNRIDTLPHFLATIDRASLGDVVQPMVDDSSAVAARWREPIALLFIDGGHGREVARRDWESWSPLLDNRSTLAIHDVFEDERLGGRAPFEEIYQPAIASGFVEVSRTGSLRVLQVV